MNRHRRLFQSCLLLLGVLIGASGCSSKGPPPKPIPGFPPPQDVPIDEALVASANQELLKLLQSDRPSDRAHAIEGLRATFPKEATEPILRGLDDRNQIVRFAAAFAAGELKLAATKPKLEEHLKDVDPKVRVAVRFALHKLGDSSHTGDLERYAQDFSSGGIQEKGRRVRGATAMVLGRMGEQSASNVLVLLRLDAEPAVCQQAEESLFLLGEDRARNTVIGYTVSRYPDDQMFGLRALSEAKEPLYRNHARAQLTSDFPEVALVAAMALGAMNADDGYGVAMIGIKSGEARQRALAATAFGLIGRTDAQPLLAPQLKDADSDVRAAASTAILRIASNPKRYTRTGDVVK